VAEYTYKDGTVAEYGRKNLTTAEMELFMNVCLKSVNSYPDVAGVSISISKHNHVFNFGKFNQKIFDLIESRKLHGEDAMNRIRKELRKNKIGNAIIERIITAIRHHTFRLKDYMLTPVIIRECIYDILVNEEGYEIIA
jgi:hypothetical protein